MLIKKNHPLQTALLCQLRMKIIFPFRCAHINHFSDLVTNRKMATQQRILNLRTLNALQWATRRNPARTTVRAMHIALRPACVRPRVNTNRITTTTGPFVSSCSSRAQQLRTYTMEHKDAVDFEQVQRIVNDKDTDYILLDVREPSEVMQGFIPSAINIPLSKLLPAWTMSAEEFEEEYGFERPNEDDKIIVYCQAGIRSANAADFLREIGYKVVLNYPGSYADYASKSSAQ
ncbi:Rhodanese-like domain-containing protein [Zychaea mexicana]|uniref:Rhodanese-like domain-containing protein n=1 Tax=Zychaea mexicana TaxID=64656 RepID=UPI0022FEB5CD|nr:Rhodanese-like domain-containing protein [Zychaea mexicana]KAI9485087.1 Rhodanese-like domain-containing protein [Zychaea mexicana]